MMNTRSRTRARESALNGKADKGVDAYLSKELTDEHYAKRLNKLSTRKIRSQKWACPTTINQLGMGNDFNLLCDNVGLRPFVF